MTQPQIETASAADPATPTLTLTERLTQMADDIRVQMDSCGRGPAGQLERAWLGLFVMLYCWLADLAGKAVPAWMDDFREAESRAYRCRAGASRSGSDPGSDCDVWPPVWDEDFDSTDEAAEDRLPRGPVPAAWGESEPLAFSCADATAAAGPDARSGGALPDAANVAKCQDAVTAAGHRDAAAAATALNVGIAAPRPRRSSRAHRFLSRGTSTSWRSPRLHIARMWSTTALGTRRR